MTPTPGLNTLRPKQNGCHFIDIFIFIFLYANCKLSERLPWDLFSRAQLSIDQNWFRSWVGMEQATSHYLNSLRPRPNRRHFADDIFKRIFENENEWISPRISLKFVPDVRINNIPALVQIMAWRRPGDKPLSEPMMLSFLTHICVTRPQWVNQWWSHLLTHICISRP